MRSRARWHRDAVVVETACDFFHAPALVHSDVSSAFAKAAADKSGFAKTAADRGVVDPLRIHHAASLVEDHRAVGEPLGDQSLELALRGAGSVEFRDMRAP